MENTVEKKSKTDYVMKWLYVIAFSVGLMVVIYASPSLFDQNEKLRSYAMYTIVIFGGCLGYGLSGIIYTAVVEAIETYKKE